MPAASSDAMPGKTPRKRPTMRLDLVDLAVPEGLARFDAPVAANSPEMPAHPAELGLAWREPQGDSFAFELEPIVANALGRMIPAVAPVAPVAPVMQAAGLAVATAPPIVAAAAPAAQAPQAPQVRIRTVVALEEALAVLASRPLKRLGEALVETGNVRPAQVRAALEEQRSRPGRQLGEILVAMGAVTAQQVKGVLARELGIPTVDVKEFPEVAEARAKVPAALCSRHRMLPLLVRDGALVVAMDDPMSAEAIEAARFSSGCRVVPVLANGEEIRDLLRMSGGVGDAYEMQGLSMPQTGDALRPRFGDSLEFDLSGVEELASRLTEELVRHDSDGEEVDTVRESDSTLVRLVNKMILDAHNQGASDVHIEPVPSRGELRVRMRRDGVLADYAVLPAKFRAALVSRIKIMANLDISERRRPQDGKIDFSRFGPAKLELRVATLPTANNQESVVLRLLASSKPRSLDDLDIEAGILARMKALADRPHGLMLVCGPTGSGKTTTLHSVIAHINTAERKIWTAEDPIEITQPGLCQVQVNPKIDLTFAAALRSFLRADPDVIMVGEMRDSETATTAVEASLTGHLVLSTLHTNSAPETVTRLLDLGVDPFNFGDTLLSVLAQRLVRRVCPHCAKHEPASAETLATLAREYVSGTNEDATAVAARWAEGKPTIATGAGCEHCGHTGYRGRIGLYEFMEVTPTLANMIRRRANANEVREEAVAGGMRSLKQDGILKVLAGKTTMSQVRAAAPN